MHLTNINPEPQTPTQESDAERELLERDQLDHGDGDDEDEVFWFIIEHQVSDEMLMLSCVAARTHDEAIENAKANQIDNIVNMFKVPDPDMTLEELNVQFQRTHA